MDSSLLASVFQAADFVIVCRIFSWRTLGFLRMHKNKNMLTLFVSLEVRNSACVISKGHPHPHQVCLFATINGAAFGRLWVSFEVNLSNTCICHRAFSALSRSLGEEGYQ